MSEKKEFTEEELNLINGGARERAKTEYKCSECNHTWTNYGSALRCPNCGSKNFSRK